MITEKDRLLKELKSFIMHDSAWLTNDDQIAIERKIDELNSYINERYKSHGRPERTYT